jgi:superfamily I DNA/RNA helicase
MLDSIGYLISMYLKPELVTPKERETIEQVISNWVNFYRQEGITDVWENLNQVLFEVDNFEDNKDDDKIQVGTIHSQKGLEQPVSIVAGFVGYRQRPDVDNDNVNMLYVQLSRAMDKLIIINSIEYVLKDGNRVPGAMLNQMKVLLSILKGD